MFNNKVSKFVSLSAGKATNVFTNCIRDLIEEGKFNKESYNEKTLMKLKKPSCYFDSRVFNVEDEREVIRNI